MAKFLKGQIPFNKGKMMSEYMSAESISKCKVGMFKSGNKPHNTNYDGHERITKDGYVEIRIREGKYALKHRVIWEQVNGKIKQGMILVFKDKDKTNIVIENLELITRVENMQRNTIQRFPRELKQAIYVLKKIKAKTNEKQNN